MRGVLILLAGYPATGKTYLCNKIIERHPELAVVSQDDIKERLWDEFGFDNLEEKGALEQRAWGEYYDELESRMATGEPVASDYPFSEKQRPRLAGLVDAYGYRAVTIRLVGDIDVLYERSRSRDLAASRHLGHLVSRYHVGDELQDRSQADCFVTADVFRERCLTRGYDTFCLGELIEVDATDCAAIDYEAVLDRLDELAGEGVG